MSKFLLAALAATTIALPSATMAQSAQEVREGEREVRQGQRDVRQAERRGDTERAAAARQEVREDRQELREDWRDYRRRNPATFRRGDYTPPRGRRYAPLRAGAQVRPEFYASRYWVNNPTVYRLPRPAAGMRYIRYGNDVLLINARTGRVARVYGNFFT